MKRILVLFLTTVLAQSAYADPAFWSLAPTPPMGWNSYTAFGGSVTENEVMANANYMKEHLLSHGWNTVVVDYRWYDPCVKLHKMDFVKDNHLAMDEYGRLLPAVDRFPDAADGNGFKPLADKIHALGMKFGIHIMRGIPRIAVKANLPIEGSDFHAADAANTGSTCMWCKDMFGVKGDTAAGQAYYDSIFRLYASWDIDFIKVDDLSNPYSKSEIDAIRKSIDKCGRPMIFSTSPGETNIKWKDSIPTKANMWRISGDFWDKWPMLYHMFDLAARWQGVGGPGHWPDCDLISLGHIGIRSVGEPRVTKFTHDEQLTLLSLWAMVPSPLFLGSDLPENDDWTLSLMTNDEMIAIDQDPLGKPARLVSNQNGLEVWARDLSDGSKAIGLFNRSDADASITATWADTGLTGEQKVRDVWQHKDLDPATDQITMPVPKHGVVLLRVTKMN